jgi:imidazolonepropionase-like amidohydrolase
MQGSRAERLFIFAVVTLIGVASGVSAQAVPGDLVLRGANVVDVTTGEVLSNAVVIVREGRIESIAGPDAPIGEGVEVVDLQGMYLSPGMIDAHVHIGSESDGRRALEFGVTTARSMGASHFADVGLRELQRAGYAEIPEIVAAGYHVRPPAAEAFFQDHPELAGLREGGVRGVDEVRAMVEALASHGVDFIKTNATERAGLPDTDPRKQFYSEAELRAIVEAATVAGIPVAAHAHGDEGALAAVRAGVRSIEHGTYMSEATLREMASRGTYLVPTVAIVTDLTQPGGDYDVPYLEVRGRHMLPRIRETVRRARLLGVPIVAATDTGYGPESTIRMGHELEELVDAGLSSLEALQAATLNAAELVGVAERTGRVAPGLEADFVVTERNPLEDIRALQDVLLVVSDGRIVVEKGDWFQRGRRRASS